MHPNTAMNQSELAWKTLKNTIDFYNASDWLKQERLCSYWLLHVARVFEPITELRSWTRDNQEQAQFPLQTNGISVNITFLVCILDLMQPISTALSAASNPSGVETLFMVNRTVFWIAFPSGIKHYSVSTHCLSIRLTFAVITVPRKKAGTL